MGIAYRHRVVPVAILNLFSSTQPTTIWFISDLGYMCMIIATGAVIPKLQSQLTALRSEKLDGEHK